MNRFIEYIREYTKDKTVCILGFGREGKATYRILSEYCSPAAITIADLNPVSKEANGLPDSVDIVCGSLYQECLERFDLVFKSPGIVLERSPRDLKCTVTSETQVFFTVYRDQIIGITGTKGKSTVTSLIYHALKESGKDAKLAGNIGIPVFDIVPEMKAESIVVCELSCHQLEYMTVSPHIAVFLNLYEEHLDHYGTMERYSNAKRNILLHQHEGDWLYINHDLETEDTGAEIRTMSSAAKEADIYVHDGIVKCGGIEYHIPCDSVKLLGIHNHYNIAVAYEVCSHYGVTDTQFQSALCTFDPLSHRLEFVGRFAGIRWYDDSISTACATAIEALKSVPDPGCILIGGMDRGIDYTPLVECLAKSSVQVICMETSGKRVYDMLLAAGDEVSSPEMIHYVPHLEDAVRLAAEVTPEGKSCVLSPAAASYGIFKNFEERGDVFKSLVKSL